MVVNKPNANPRKAQQARVCLMAKAPVAGQVKTRLCPPLNSEEAAMFAAAFLLDTWEVANVALAVPALLATKGAITAFPAELAAVSRIGQRGGDLGARIEAAIEDTLTTPLPQPSRFTPSASLPSVLSPSAALVIGSDLPGLPVGHIRAACDLLVEHDVCIGPSTARGDGGYYLIGSKNPLDGALHGVSWSAPTTREETITALQQRGLSVALAPAFDDTDTFADLKTLMATKHLAPRTRRQFEEIFPTGSAER